MEKQNPKQGISKPNIICPEHRHMMFFMCWHFSGLKIYTLKFLFTKRVNSGIISRKYVKERYSDGKTKRKRTK